MSDMFGIKAGTYQLWEEVGPEPLTCERIMRAIEHVEARSRCVAMQSFEPIVSRALVDQIAALEKAK